MTIVDERMKELHIPREDFHELREIVKRLAQAQAKTEERVGRLEEAVERLAQAQARGSGREISSSSGKDRGGGREVNSSSGKDREGSG